MSKPKAVRAKHTKSDVRLVSVEAPTVFEGALDLPVFTKMKTGAREALLHELRVTPAADWLETYVEGMKDVLLDLDDGELEEFLTAWIAASEEDPDSPKASNK